MEQKPVSLLKSSLTSGVYLGIVLILVSVILYVAGLSFASWAQYVSYPVLIIGAAWAQISYKKALGGEMTYKCGEKPGKGWYVCIACGEDLYLDQDTDTLPPCAKCEKCEFRKKIT